MGDQPTLRALRLQLHLDKLNLNKFKSCGLIQITGRLKDVSHLGAAWH